MASTANAATNEQGIPPFAAIDSTMHWLEEAAGTYPPRFSMKHPESLVRARLDSLILTVEGYVATQPANPQLEWRLGELYRMGHNLDIHNAWKNSQAHLQRALALDSTSTMAHLALGYLYVESDTTLAAVAEAHFRSVLKGPVDSVALSFDAPYLAEFGIVEAFLHRHDLPNAMAAAKRALVYKPGNRELQKMVTEYEKDSTGWRTNNRVVP